MNYYTDEYNKSSLDYLFQFIISFIIISSNIFTYQIFFSSKHFVSAFNIPIQNAGLYISNLYGLRWFLISIGSLISCIICISNFENDIVCIVVYSILLLIRSLLVIFLYISKKLSLHIYILINLEALFWGFFQNTFESIIPEYAGIVSVSSDVSPMIVLLIITLFERIIKINSLNIIKIQLWFCLAFSTISYCFLILYIFYSYRKIVSLYIYAVNYLLSGSDPIQSNVDDNKKLVNTFKNAFDFVDELINLINGYNIDNLIAIICYNKKEDILEDVSKINKNVNFDNIYGSLMNRIKHLEKEDENIIVLNLNSITKDGGGFLLNCSKILVTSNKSITQKLIQKLEALEKTERKKIINKIENLISFFGPLNSLKYEKIKFSKYPIEQYDFDVYKKEKAYELELEINTLDRHLNQTCNTMNEIISILKDKILNVFSSKKLELESKMLSLMDSIKNLEEIETRILEESKSKIALEEKKKQYIGKIKDNIKDINSKLTELKDIKNQYLDKIEKSLQKIKELENKSNEFRYFGNNTGFLIAIRYAIQQFLMIIPIIMIKGFIYPGIVPCAILEKDKWSLVENILPLFCIIGSVVIFLLYENSIELKMDQTIITYFWSCISIPITILVILMLSIHSKIGIFRGIIGSRIKVIVLLGIFMISSRLLECVSYIGVAECAFRITIYIDKSFGILMCHNSIKSILWYLFNKISVGYNEVRVSMGYCLPQFHRDYGFDDTFSYWFNETFKCSAKGILSDLKMNIKEYI